MKGKEITLDGNGFAVKAGFITVYNYNGETREYISSSVEYLPFGVGVPGNSCVDAPITNKYGFAICRKADLTGWEYVADHRGETVYDTKTGQKITISAIGEYPENTTTKAPLTQHDKWRGNEWVTDTDKQHAEEVTAANVQKRNLLSEAKATISLWQTELQLGIISDDDKSSLISWMKYIQALNTVDISTASDIEWPVKPD